MLRGGCAAMCFLFIRVHLILEYSKNYCNLVLLVLEYMATENSCRLSSRR